MVSHTYICAKHWRKHPACLLVFDRQGVETCKATTLVIDVLVSPLSKNLAQGSYISTILSKYIKTSSHIPI